MEQPTPDLNSAISELRAEIAIRERVYPKWIAQNRLTHAKAAYKLACLCLALENLLDLAQQPQLKLR